MQATFKTSGNTYLRVGNDIVLPDQHQLLGYIGIVEERDAPRVGPVSIGEPEPPPVCQTIAVLKPHEARALASILLAAATEGTKG